MHKYLILSVSHGGFYGTRNEYGIVRIVYTYLRKYTPKIIKPMRKVNNIACG